MVGVKQFQTLQRERRAGTIAQQPLPVPKEGRRDRARPRAPRHPARTRCSVGWGSKGSHLVHVVRLDQPAAGKPLPPPYAYLLGDGGEGLRCQLGGGAKAQGLRAITSLLDRLEHPVDDAAVVMDVPVEGGTEAVDEAHRFEAGL